MREALLVDVVRTPFMRARGALSDVHPVELLADALSSLTERTGIDGSAIDDVIVGCVTQAGEQGLNVARSAVLAAGLPERVPATTVDRQCGSSQQAVTFAALGIQAGYYDVVIAGGVESMTRAPMGSAVAGHDPFGQKLRSRYRDGLVPQGIAAELIAARWGISRTEADEIALASHGRAAAARARGVLARDIAPVKVETSGGMVLIEEDDGIRDGTTLDRLAALQPAFYAKEWEALYPEIRWRVTAGNSSQITDGAAAALVASRDATRRLGLQPRARLVSFAVAANDPITMLTAIIPATRRLLAKTSVALDDIDVFEVNEAFASVVAAWQRDLDVDMDKVNPNGGAIALGHPLGASGIRLLGSLVAALEERDGRYGVQVMCEAGGQANATLVELLPGAER